MELLEAAEDENWVATQRIYGIMQEFIGKKGPEQKVSEYSFYQDDIFTEFSIQLNWDRKIYWELTMDSPGYE